MKSQYIFCNNLYKKDKSLAISEIKKCSYDNLTLLKYLSIDFLTDLKVWNEEVSRQVISYNTKNFFINYRYKDVKFRVLNIIMDNKQEEVCDSLLLLDLYMSINRNFFYINLNSFIVELNKGRLFTIEYCKLLKDQNNILFQELVKNVPGLYKFILVNDQNLLDDKKFIRSLIGSDSTDLALISLPYSEWYVHRQYINDEFIKKYFFKFQLADLFNFKDAKFVWDNLKDQPYSVRYEMYSHLKYNCKVIEHVRQDIKNLVKSNYKTLGLKYKKLFKDTISIIKEIIDQIVVFPALINLTVLLIKEMEDLSKDIIMFYLLRYITKKPQFVNGAVFCRWYINITKFIKIFIDEVDSSGLQDLIDSYIENKVYSSILLFEITKRSKHVFDINEVFLYEDYDIKLKEEVFERYQVILGSYFPKCDIQYLSGLEINKLEFNYTRFEYKEEYLYIRNVAKLLNNNIDCINKIEGIEDFFNKCCKSQDEDIRLIGNSMISKIKIHKRIKK